MRQKTISKVNGSYILLLKENANMLIFHNELLRYTLYLCLLTTFIKICNLSYYFRLFCSQLKCFGFKFIFRVIGFFYRFNKWNNIKMFVQITRIVYFKGVPLNSIGVFFVSIQKPLMHREIFPLLVPKKDMF